jgi:hypothetical protein
MLLAALDWTMILDTLILTLPAIIAAIYAARIHKKVTTPSGKPLGEVAEYAHDTVIANNMLLRKANGPTRQATPGQLHTEAESPPSVPGDEPPL